MTCSFSPRRLDILLTSHGAWANPPTQIICKSFGLQIIWVCIIHNTTPQHWGETFDNYAKWLHLQNVQLLLYVRLLVFCTCLFDVRDNVHGVKFLILAKFAAMEVFPSVHWRCWLGDRKGIRPVKLLDVGLLVVTFDWSFARLIAPVVTTTSIILSSNKVQNGDILVPTKKTGKWPIKERDGQKVMG